MSLCVREISAMKKRRNKLHLHYFFSRIFHQFDFDSEITPDLSPCMTRFLLILFIYWDLHVWNQTKVHANSLRSCNKSKPGASTLCDITNSRMGWGIELYPLIVPETLFMTRKHCFSDFRLKLIHLFDPRDPLGVVEPFYELQILWCKWFFRRSEHIHWHCTWFQLDRMRSDGADWRQLHWRWWRESWKETRLTFKALNQTGGWSK